MSDQIIILSLVFLAVICALWGIYKMADSGKEASSDTPALFRILGPGIFFFSAEAGSLLEGMFPSFSEKLRSMLRKSALPLEAKDIYGAFLFFGFIGGILGFILAYAIDADVAVYFLLILLFAFVFGIYPHVYLKKIETKREHEILNNLPFAIDLISSSMNAGLDFVSAVRYLLSTWKNNIILKKEFTTFLNDVELGKTRTDALNDMQRRIDVKEFTRFISAISHGMDSGSSIIDIMRIQSEEMRRIKFARAEQQAAKAPTKMIVPMVVFIFPSMFIIIFVAIFLRVKDSGAFHMIGK